MLQTIISALIKFVQGQRRIRQRFRKFPSPDLGAREGTHAQMEFIINGGGVILARIGRATQKERERERERERWRQNFISNGGDDDKTQESNRGTPTLENASSADGPSGRRRNPTAPHSAAAAIKGIKSRRYITLDYHSMRLTHSNNERPFCLGVQGRDREGHHIAGITYTHAIYAHKVRARPQRRVSSRARCIHTHTHVINNHHQE